MCTGTGNTGTGTGTGSWICVGIGNTCTSTTTSHWMSGTTSWLYVEREQLGMVPERFSLIASLQLKESKSKVQQQK